MSAFLIVAAVWCLPAVMVVAWVAADRWLDNRCPAETDWAPDTEASITEALAVVDETPIYTDVLANHEAARFKPDAVDWNQPAVWREVWR